MTLRRWVPGLAVFAFVACMATLAFRTQFKAASEEGDTSAHRLSLEPEFVFRKTRAVMGKFAPRMRGHCDFWFENRDSDAVELGLMSKSCACADLQFCVLSPEEGRRYTAWAIAAGARQAGAAAFGLLGGLSQLIVERDVTPDWTNAKVVLTAAQWNQSEGITVPPKYCGIIRLGWNDTKGLVRREFLSADLWAALAGMDYKTYPRLEALVVVVADLPTSSEDLTAADWEWEKQAAPRHSPSRMRALPPE
jgi:hypothetical protein